MNTDEWISIAGSGEDAQITVSPREGAKGQTLAGATLWIESEDGEAAVNLNKKATNKLIAELQKLV